MSSTYNQSMLLIIILIYRWYVTGKEEESELESEGDISGKCSAQFGNPAKKKGRENHVLCHYCILLAEKAI